MGSLAFGYPMGTLTECRLPGDSDVLFRENVIKVRKCDDRDNPPFSDVLKFRADTLSLFKFQKKSTKKTFEILENRPGGQDGPGLGWGQAIRLGDAAPIFNHHPPPFMFLPI